MSQKSILSFFKLSNQSTTKETKNKIVVVSDSPVKKTKNKRKVQCIESDDESDIPVKKLNGECKTSETTEDKVQKSSKTSEDKVEKSSETSNDKVEKSSDLNSINVENVKVKRNDDSPSRKLTKPMKMENDDETNPCNSTKMESDTLQQSEEKISENGISSDSFGKTYESSCSNQNDFKDFIPKRKTARKQMSSSKENVPQLKEETHSKVDDELEMKNITTPTEFNSENEKLDSEIKIENNSFEPKSIVEKNSESKETKVMKISPVSKRKVSSSSKNKGSPLKKHIKKESIHSFFTPLKKTEDKNGTEDYDDQEIQESSSTLEVNDDSPIKIVQKKRINVLESDDEEDNEDESVSKEVSNEKKIEVTEAKDNSSVLSEENKVVKSESPVSEVNKTLEKRPASENSESNNADQKLSIKSTSAVNTTYNPSKHNYHPIEDAFWKRNEKVPYLALAKTLELIENTSGRLKTIEILANYFRSVIVLSPDDLLHSVYLCLNRVAPEYEGIEMGVGETLLMKAVAQATGRTVDKIKAEVAIKGDLGLVSESSRGNQRVMFAPPKLTVSSVFNKFLEIAKMSGNAAMAKKIDKIKMLFVACRDCEAKYIIRSLSGKLRIGLAEQSILCAIARAVVLTPPGQEYPPRKVDISKGMSADSLKELLDSQTLILKTAYCECPNYDLIIPVLLKHGISALPDHCQLSPGVPLKPMLAHPTDGIDKVLERFDKNAFTCEFKYDGERAQIHMNDKGVVNIFSRNQEDNTSKYPDVVSRISNVLKETTKSFILDSEAVAWDIKTKQILPFQVLSTRKRKDAVESEIVVQVCIMAFDLLYLNGESLVKKPLKERRSLLHSNFNEVENQFMFAQYRDGNSAETMQEFLDESVKGNCEGLMVKSLEVDASYEIAKRSRNWLKLKKDYLQGIGDTLDLVVIGGYYGKGKRTGNYGGFLLACYDKENEEFQSICKLGTGFKDNVLEAHTKFLKAQVIEEPKSYFRYDHSLEPDVWFQPVQVWEIKCADLSISPVHRAAIGIVDPEKGISLRFPRFVRIRDDKNPENATSSVQIADMYNRQQQIQNTAKTNVITEEDYY